MAKPRTLASLLDTGFADGYQQFAEVIELTGKIDSLPVTERAFIRLYELALVAAVEGLNKVEEEFEIDPAEALVLQWKATGAAMASVNAQGFKAEGRLQVRREMLHQLKEGYDKTWHALISGISEEAP